MFKNVYCSDIRGTVSINVLTTKFPFMKLLYPYSGVTRNVIQHADLLSGCSLCFLNRNDSDNGGDTVVS